MAKLENELKPTHKHFNLIENKRLELESIKIDNDETIIYIRNGTCGGITFENNRPTPYHSIIEDKIREIFKGIFNFSFCGSSM